MRKAFITVIVIVAMMLGTMYSFAADPNVTIVSPGQTVYGNTLLLSVKMTAPMTVQISAYEQKQSVNGTFSPIDPDNISTINVNKIKSISIMNTETFTCQDNLRFYSKQLNNVTPGLYKIVVETKSGGKTIDTTSTLTVVRPAGENKNISFENQQQGALKKFQNFLKSIFGS